MKNKQLADWEIRRIVANIEDDYRNLSNPDWYRVVESLMNRTKGEVFKINLANSDKVAIL